MQKNRISNHRGAYVVITMQSVIVPTNNAITKTNDRNIKNSSFIINQIKLVVSFRSEV